MDVQEIKLRLDPARVEEIRSKVEEMGLSGHSELFRRIWDDYGRHLRGPAGRAEEEETETIAAAG